jgi:cytochrome c oxidase cbb3-type subunit III
MTVSSSRWSPVLLVALAAATSLSAQPNGSPPRVLPDGPGREIVQRVCGSTCHGAELVIGKGNTRDGWGATVNSMISRGAKASDSELTEIVDYLARNLPPKTGAAGAGGSGFLGAGADDAHVVDPAAANRGRAIYIAQCVTCHGSTARGGDGPPKQHGPDLVRSLLVLKDRYGSLIGAFLKAGHPTQSGKPSSDIDGTGVIDLAHFLHQKVTDTLRSGPYNKPINVLTGNAKDGEAYFNGAGGCAKCHSVSGDLAGISGKYAPEALQQKFVFPRTFAPTRGARRAVPKEVTLTVTPASGAAVTGTVIHLDDFNVSLRDKDGEYHTWKRTASLQVIKNDPYQAHVDLLDRYTDKNIHDIVAYLETVK